MAAAVIRGPAAPFFAWYPDGMKWLGGVLLAYGVIMIALGVYAFVKDKSLMSLIGGGTIGVLAITGAAVAQTWPSIGYGIAAFATLAAMGRFALPFFRDQKWYPAGVIFILSAITLICLAVGHLQNRTSTVDVPSDEKQETSEK